MFVAIKRYCFITEKKIGTSVLMLFSYERQTTMNPFSHPFRAPITLVLFEHNL